jgi:hypothetical protein
VWMEMKISGDTPARNFRAAWRRWARVLRGSYAGDYEDIYRWVFVEQETRNRNKSANKIGILLVRNELELEIDSSGGRWRLTCGLQRTGREKKGKEGATLLLACTCTLSALGRPAAHLNVSCGWVRPAGLPCLFFLFPFFYFLISFAEQVLDI